MIHYVLVVCLLSYGYDPGIPLFRWSWLLCSHMISSVFFLYPLLFCRRYFGANTICYLLFHFAFAKLPASFILNDSPSCFWRLANPLPFYMKEFSFCTYRLAPFLNLGHSTWFSLHNKRVRTRIAFGLSMVVAEGGFEPPTSGLWARRATKLLYSASLISIYIIASWSAHVNSFLFWAKNQPPSKQLWLGFIIISSAV